VKNLSIDISGKLSTGLVGLYSAITEYTAELGIRYLVVGAMARDLVRQSSMPIDKAIQWLKIYGDEFVTISGGHI